MPTSRHRTTAISGGSPEILVVAGGRDSDFNKVDTVEVLQGDHWTTATPLPTHCSDMHSTFYEGNFYFTGGDYQQKLIYTVHVVMTHSWHPVVKELSHNQC